MAGFALHMDYCSLKMSFDRQRRGQFIKVTYIKNVTEKGREEWPERATQHSLPIYIQMGVQGKINQSNALKVFKPSFALCPINICSLYQGRTGRERLSDLYSPLAFKRGKDISKIFKAERR